MHGKTRLISVWFFVGVLLLCYGVLIFAASWYYAANPPAQLVVLADLHVGVWWGLLLVVVGGIYTWKFRPGNDNA
jgi:hypothetical protein